MNLLPITEQLSILAEHHSFIDNTAIFLKWIPVIITADIVSLIKATATFRLPVITAICELARHSIVIFFEMEIVLCKFCSPLRITFPFGLTESTARLSDLQGKSFDPHEPSKPFSLSTYVVSPKVNVKTLLEPLRMKKGQMTQYL